MSEGETIAVLEQYTYRRRMNETNTALRKAKLELQNLLIGQGYNMLADSAKIPKALYETAALRSGYLAALGEEQDARHAYQSTVLKVPFSGKIANLKYKVYEQGSPDEVFCILIDDAEFEVEFFLLTFLCQVTGKDLRPFWNLGKISKNKNDNFNNQKSYEKGSYHQYTVLQLPNFAQHCPLFPSFGFLYQLSLA